MDGAQQTFPGMPVPLYRGSPSKLLCWVECPRRYRMTYLDRPRPPARPQRGHTSVGLSTHNTLSAFWDLPTGRRTPDGVAELVRTSWIDVGFRDTEQSLRWRDRVRVAVTEYLRTSDRETQPLGIERSVSLRTEQLTVTGRVDRIDDRGGELVVVDYKTGRSVPTDDDARTSLALGLYAVAVGRMFRRPCHRVELHHVPTGSIATHVHTDESLARKIAEAESIAHDLRRADASFEQLGPDSPLFPPRPSALCSWCDLRAHCPEGRQMGPEKPDWAGLDEPGATPHDTPHDTPHSTPHATPRGTPPDSVMSG